MVKKNYRIAFFGFSLASAHWNGAATYYRGIIKALNYLEHHIPDPDWAEIVIYEPNEESAANMLLKAQNYDIVVKANGVGVLDSFLEHEILNNRQTDQLIIFWDVDAPATLHSMKTNSENTLRDLIPEFDLILTYSGDQPVIDAYTSYGAQKCVPIYNTAPEEAFACDLGFLGNRLPDREKRVEEFFLKPASQLPEKKFLLGGNGWENISMPENVNYIGHVYTKNHNAFNSSAKAVLNINRDSMAKTGFSPATRVFEAAGADACIITDAWKRIEQFLEPDKEILIAESGEDVIELLENISEKKAKAIGTAALKKVRAEHTYAIRAKYLAEVLNEVFNFSKNLKYAQQTA